MCQHLPQRSDKRKKIHMQQLVHFLSEISHTPTLKLLDHAHPEIGRGESPDKAQASTKGAGVE